MTPQERPYLKAVKERTQRVIDTLVSPQVSDWKRIDQEHTMALRMFCNATRQETATLGINYGPEVLQKLNADARFQTHLDIMDAYVDVLISYPQFHAFLEEEGITPDFIHALVHIHDYGRNVFNGPLPLKYIDGVSDGIVRKMLPTFPTEYLHSIKWLTGEAELPESDSELQNNEKIGLMLKAIDTLGKLDQKGELMDPDVFFAKDGPYERWVSLQHTNGRFPFLVRAVKDTFKGKKLVTADEYIALDKSLTLRGIRIIESLTDGTFAQIRQAAAEIFRDRQGESEAVSHLNN